MKKIRIYSDTLDNKTLEQFDEAMKIDCNIQGALMPDAHAGYTLPIGSVIKSKNKIFPSYVGYDIGCGMCAVKLEIKKEEVNLELLKEFIIKKIPLGKSRHEKQQDYKIQNCTIKAKEFFETLGKYQLGTLGGGNHFIELGIGKDDFIWIIVHSGSRGFGKLIAEHYMNLAALVNMDKDKIVNDFEEKNKNFKLNNPSKFEEVKNKHLNKMIEDLAKKGFEKHNGFCIDSTEGKDYILDMKSALQFALDNRKEMIYKIVNFLGNPKELMFINRNHNHAEIIDDFVIHRKGATHANKDMLGVIPGNMKDGSFIVKGKGNNDSLNSSSHGAGRVLSRRKAMECLDYDEFDTMMKNIVTNHKKETLDESPKAYKNIFEVMDLQKDLVEVIDYIKPILNIKG